MDAGGLRQRRAAAEAVPGKADSKPRPSKEKRSETSAARAPASDARPPTGVALVSTFLVALVFYGTWRLRNEILTVRPEDFTPGSVESAFDGDQAMRHVAVIAAKPRLVGSKALDESFDYVEEKIREVVAVAEANGMNLEVERLVSSGNFVSGIGNTSVTLDYSDVLSVVARLSPAKSADATDEASLLVNAHVDSALGAPGANDCAACVSIGLESLRALARTSVSVTKLSRPIVFLFNGAEEALLIGAHSFVTSHRWAQTVAAHINLESMGSGKKFSLFQIGPQNPWLAEAYARAVRKPWASVAGSDVFEHGLIPGETDFRVFKEHGIPGYDFALIENGCVYHTRYDDVKHVHREGLMHGGPGTVIPLVLELAGGPDAIGSHLRRAEGDERDSPSLVYRIAKLLPAFVSLRPGNQARASFFDVLGLFTVTYSDSVSLLVVWVLFTLSVVLFSGILPTGLSSPEAAGPLSLRLRMLGTLFLATVAGFSSSTVAALFYLHGLGRPLAWYGSTRFLFAVFAPPTLIGVTVALQLLLPRNITPSVASASMHMAVTLAYGTVMFLVASLGALMSFVPKMALLGCVTATFLPWRKDYVFVRFVWVLVPTAIFGFSTGWDAVTVFVGIFGRSGKLQSEIVAAAMTAFYTILYGLLPLLPLYAFYPFAMRRVRKYLLIVAVFFAWLVYMLPELTLPHRDAVYSKDAPKRILAIHFHSPGLVPGNVLGLYPMDAVSIDINTTVRMFPFYDKDALREEPTWGRLGSSIGEGARPYLQFLSNPTSFEVQERVGLAVPTAFVVSEKPDPDVSNRVVVSIRVSAPDSMQISVRLRPKESGGSVIWWSLSDNVVDLGDGGGAWVRHVGRGEGAENMDFSVAVEVDEETGERPSIEFDVSSVRPGSSKSETMRKLYFPMWTAPVFVQSTGAGFAL